jgi:hypothetical protein
MSRSKAQRPLGTSIQVTSTPEEQRAFVEAARALEISISDLLRLACLETCHRMGLSHPNHVPNYLEPFTLQPERSERVSAANNIRLNPLFGRLFTKAAELSGPVPLSRFIVGATLAFVARHQRNDPQLKHVVLPEQYRSIA